MITSARQALLLLRERQIHLTMIRIHNGHSNCTYELRCQYDLEI